MNKICTDVKQSKKLIELGIDVNTADMRYGYIAPYDFSDRMYDGGYDEVPYPKDFLKKNPNFSANEYEEELPAWTLTALLELIPPYLGEFKDGIDFGFSKALNGKWYSAYYIKLNDNGLASFNKTVTGDTAIDAAFEMVCWLKENGKI